jgi:hypothetical protein
MDIALGAFEAAGDSVGIINGKALRGIKSGGDALLEIRVAVLDDGRTYVAWHVHPDSGAYWPLEFIFPSDDAALDAVNRLSSQMARFGMGWQCLLEAEQSPEAIRRDWLMRREALISMERTGEIRFPTFWERLVLRLRSKPCPEFFWCS